MFPIRNTAVWLKRAVEGVPGSTAPPSAGSTAPKAPPAVGKVSTSPAPSAPPPAAPPAAPAGGAPKPPLLTAGAKPATPFTDKLMSGVTAATNPSGYTAKPLDTPAPMAAPGQNMPAISGTSGATMAPATTGTHINGTGANASVQPAAPGPSNPFTGGGLTSPHAPVGGQSAQARANDNTYRQNYMSAAMQYARDKNDPTNVSYQGPISGQAKDRATANAITSSGGYVLPGGASSVGANGARNLNKNPYGSGSATTIPTVGTPEHAKWLANKSVTDDGKTIKGPDSMRQTLEPMLPAQQQQSDKAFALNMAKNHPEAFNGVLAPGTAGSSAGATGYVNAVQGMPNGSVQLPTAAQGPTLSLNLPPAGQAQQQQAAAAKTIAANAPPPPPGGMNRPDPQVMPVGAPPLPPPEISPGTMAAFNQGAAGASPPVAGTTPPPTGVKSSSRNPFI